MSWNGDLAQMRKRMRNSNFKKAEDVIQRDERACTPLHYAASGSSTELVALLLKEGALIDARSPNGTTPLMMAARYGAIDSADLLLKGGADAALVNERGMTAADFVAGAGREALAARLRLR